MLDTTCVYILNKHHGYCRELRSRLVLAPQFAKKTRFNLCLLLVKNNTAEIRILKTFRHYKQKQ